MLSQREKGFIFGAILVALEGLKKELVTRDRKRQKQQQERLEGTEEQFVSSHQSNDVIAVEEVIEEYKRTWKINRGAPHDVVILVPWVYQNLALRIEEQDDIDKDLWAD